MFKLQPQQDIRPPGGRSSGAQYQYTLQAENTTDLNEWAPKVKDKLQTLPGLTDVNSDQQTHGLQTYLHVDRDTAYRLGLNFSEVDNLLYDAFGQRQVSTMFTALNQYHVVMEVDPKFAQDPSALKNLYAINSKGVPIPLSSFAKYSSDATPLAITHQSQFPCVTISFNLLPNASLGSAVSEIENAVREMGLPPTVHGTFAGTANAFQQSLGTMVWLIAAALLAVYLVLGMLYESLIHPITILSTIPSAGVGALIALILVRINFSLIALIGIILLIGIVKKNAIMMIDFALAAERGEGKSPRDAIFQACMLRFRPISMTTMAALFGGLPLAIGGGIGSELRRPLGVAVVGGLVFSQMLTLYTTPVIYLYLDRLRLWITGHGDRPLAPIHAT
jgi:multidrug efflux pump